MRRTGMAIVLAGATLALGGCAALGLGGDTAGGSSATAREGATWINVAEGKATPSPSETMGRPSATPTTSLSMPAPDPSCTKNWTRTEAVLIPVEVTPGSGSLTVEWPTQYGSNYRVTAVPQALVSGAQPEPTWQEVPPGAGCAMSTTLTGLTPGAAYIVWLDAPNSGRAVDGTRHLYSGRSGVVYPL